MNVDKFEKGFEMGNDIWFKCNIPEHGYHCWHNMKYEESQWKRMKRETKHNLIIFSIMLSYTIALTITLIYALKG